MKQNLIVGYSGGRDSSYLLWKLVKENNYNITAVHVNHGIRGEEALRDEDFCRKVCSELNVKLIVSYVDVPLLVKENGGSLETVAAEKRREILLSEARSNNAAIALAHHMNDKVETSLFFLCRGSGGFKGMTSSIIYKGVEIIRPLLGMTREEITKECIKNNIEWVDDSTNNVNDVTRNIIRNEVIPNLGKALGRDIVKSYSRSIDIQESNNIALSEALDNLPLLDPQNRLFLPFLSNKSDDFIKSVIHWFLKRNNVTKITTKSVDSILNVIKSTDNSASSIMLGGGCLIKRKEKRLVIEK